MVLFDNNVLCLLLHPDADVPNDPATGAPIDRAAERVAYLVDQLKERGVMIVIPTPVVMEFLTFADPQYLLEINRSIWFDVAPFDQRAAIEAAVALRRALEPGGAGKTLGMPGAKWQKVKVDRQIVAIGKVKNVTAVYSTDKEMLTIARESGLTAVHVAHLPVPPADEGQQMTLNELLATSPEPSTEPSPPAKRLPDVEPE